MDDEDPAPPLPPPEDEDDLPDIKDGAFIIEAIRSFMCKHYGLYHPFQQVTENIFTQDEEDINILKIVDELNVTLKQTASNPASLLLLLVFLTYQEQKKKNYAHKNIQK